MPKLEVHHDGETCYRVFPRYDSPDAPSRTTGSDCLVLVLPSSGGELYVQKSEEYLALVSFTKDLQEAARFTPDPAKRWLKEYLPYFPTMRTLEVHEHHLLTKVVRPENRKEKFVHNE